MKSISEIGQTTPIKVIIVNDEDFDAELVDGERRLEACRRLGRMIKAVEDDEVTNEDQQFEHCVAANFGREDHDCVEIAHAVDRFLKKGKTPAQIANIFGKSTAWVYQHHSLLRLHASVLQMLIPPEGDEEESESIGRSGYEPGSHNNRRPDQAALPFSIALLLVPLSHEAQRKAASDIVRKELNMAGARRYVMRLVSGGFHTDTREFSPSLEWSRFEKLVPLMVDKFGIFMDMPRERCTAMIKSTTFGKRRATVAKLRELSESMLALAKEVERFNK